MECNSCWHLKSPIDMIRLFTETDINLIGGDHLGSSGHLVLPSSGESEKSPLTQSKSGSWNSALAASGPVCLASIFVCHSELASSSGALC